MHPVADIKKGLRQRRQIMGGLEKMKRKPKGGAFPDPWQLLQFPNQPR
jgi:hypothetical protein